MEFRLTTIADVMPELAQMVDTHWKEISHLGKDTVSPDWDKYQMLEDVGMFVIFVAEEDGKLCGYNCYSLVTMLVDKEVLQASTEGLYLIPEKRGGRNALNLIKFSEQELKSLGVYLVTAGVNPKRDYSNLLRHLDYELGEMIFIKVLK